MEVSITRLTQFQIEITGEIPAGDFELYWQKAVKKISSEISIPGFRPGTVPENILISRLGEKAIFEEATEIAIKETYPKILKEHKIDAIGRPEITITKIARGNPLGFKIKTAVMPEFTLPDYKSIAKNIIAKNPAKIEVSAQEINDALEYLRKIRAQKDASVTGEKEEEQTLPELNDEFAKSLGQFETLEKLKNALRENILLEKRLKEKEKMRENILSEISDKTQIDIPETLIEAQKERIKNNLQENLSHAKIEWNEYLEKIKKSEEDLKKEWQKEAEIRVRYGLILDKLASIENILVSEEELNEKFKEVSKHYEAEHRTDIDELAIKEYAYSIIRNEKIFEALGG